MGYIFLAFLWAALLIYALGMTLVTWGMWCIGAGICAIAAAVTACIEERP